MNTRNSLEMPCKIGDPIWAILATMKPFGASCKPFYEFAELVCGGFIITENYKNGKMVPKTEIIPRCKPHGFQKCWVYTDHGKAIERFSKLKGI